MSYMHPRHRMMLELLRGLAHLVHVLGRVIVSAIKSIINKSST